MDNFVLVKDSKYEGGYVAVTSVTDHTVIAFGPDPRDVRDEAKKLTPNPMIFFVPAKDMACCY
jgi:hypothetical protein